MKNFLDCTVQCDRLRSTQASSGPFRVEPGAEQCLVDVDVAESRDTALVEQGALQLRGPTRQASREDIRGEAGVEGLRADGRVEHDELFRHQVEHPTELALVGEAEIRPVVELYDEVLKSKRRGITGRDLENACHPKVDHQGCVVVEVEEEILAAAEDAVDPASNDPGTRRVDAQRPDDAQEVPYPQAGDRATGGAVQEAPADRFYFW